MMEVCLFLCGEVMLGRGIDQIFPHPSLPRLYEAHVKSAASDLGLAETANGPIPRRVAPDYVWGDALAVLRDTQSAARIINLETAVTVSDRPWPKGINDHMHPDNIGCLGAARIDGCVLAVLDWDRAGLLETLASLQRAGIRVAGAGHDDAEAAAPAVIPLAGAGRVQVSGLAASTSGAPRDWAAGAATLGVTLLADLRTETAARLAEAAQRGGRSAPS